MDCGGLVAGGKGREERESESKRCRRSPCVCRVCQARMTCVKKRQQAARCSRPSLPSSAQPSATQLALASRNSQRSSESAWARQEPSVLACDFLISSNSDTTRLAGCLTLWLAGWLAMLGLAQGAEVADYRPNFTTITLPRLRPLLSSLAYRVAS